MLNSFHFTLALVVQGAQDKLIEMFCSTCKESFDRLDNLRRHEVKCVLKKPSFVCRVCSRIVYSETYFKKHVAGHGEQHTCSSCSKTYSKKCNLLNHQKNCNVQQESSECGIGQKRPLTSENPQMVFNKRTNLSTDGFEIETIKTAFKNAAITWRIKYREHEIINLLQTSIFAVKSNLIKYRELKNALKFNMAFYAVFEKAVDSAV